MIKSQNCGPNFIVLYLWYLINHNYNKLPKEIKKWYFTSIYIFILINIESLIVFYKTTNLSYSVEIISLPQWAYTVSFTSDMAVQLTMVFQYYLYIKYYIFNYSIISFCNNNKSDLCTHFLLLNKLILYYPREKTLELQ